MFPGGFFFFLYLTGACEHIQVKKEENGTIHVIKQRQLHLSCDIISLSVSTQLQTNPSARGVCDWLNFTRFALGLAGPLPMQWINSRTLVLVDSHEKLQVVDRPSQEVLETLDLEQVQLVYNSRHFKSLATGGNVSQALVRESGVNEHLQRCEFSQSGEQMSATPHLQGALSPLSGGAVKRCLHAGTLKLHHVDKVQNEYLSTSLIINERLLSPESAVWVSAVE